MWANFQIMWRALAFCQVFVVVEDCFHFFGAIFGLKTPLQLMCTFQSPAFFVHILSYFTLVNHKGSRWPVLFQFPCRHDIPTELVVGVGASHSCVYYRVILHQRTFPPSMAFFSFFSRMTG